MGTVQPVAEKQVVGRRLLPRGQTPIASAGVAVAGLLLAAVAASAAWAHFTHRSSVTTTRAEQVQAAGDLLSQSAEAMLARNDLSPLRRMLSEAGRSYHFSDCRILLPDGKVLASLHPSEINARELPAQWPEGPAATSAAAPAPGLIRLGFPLNVSGHGKAELEIAAPVSGPSWADSQTLSGFGAIAAATIFLLLLIYRRMRRRLRSLGAIREALLSAAAGEAAAGSLALASDLGPEAQAWNDLLGELEKLRKQGVAERVKETLGRRHEAKNDLDAACDALSQGLLLIDEQGHVKYANGAAAAFLQARREELHGAEVAKFLHVESVLEAVRETSAGTSRRRTVHDIERQEGGPAGVLRFTVRPVRRDDSASAMLTIEDITQQKVAEEARHTFVAQATHELRTPLTNIRLYVETAIEGGEEDPAMRAKCLNVINGETRRLERIVGEMLSVAEIEAGSFKLHRDDVRLDAVFEELKADYGQQAAEKKIDLTFNLPPKYPPVKGDRDKIMMALHNLIGNALKYTPDGGRVMVSVDASKAGQLLVEVKDSGIGISPDDAEKIFDRFYRAKDPRVAKITGSGLGLTLAREVARLHGGDITVESEVNRGSTFMLALPIVAEAA